ncbi:hypothetical protein Bca4012_024751 [Brassica carinata]
MELGDSAAVIPDSFVGYREDITTQMTMILDQIRALLIVPVLRLGVYICLTMSVMLFVERVYMGIVISLVKLFGRKPEKRFKWEPMKDDIELGNSVYPMLSIRVACGRSWPSDRIVIQVLDDSTDPLIKDLVEMECSRWASKGVNIKYEEELLPFLLHNPKLALDQARWKFGVGQILFYHKTCKWFELQTKDEITEQLTCVEKVLYSYI